MDRKIKLLNPSGLGLFVIVSLFATSRVSMAQLNLYGDPETNLFELQTNSTSLYGPVGPSTPGSGLSSGPFMGTSSVGAAHQNTFIPTGPPLAEWGPIRFYPHLLYSLTYGNGIQGLPGENSTSLVNTVSPGLLIGLGSVWYLDYNPSFSVYSNPLFRNTVDERVNLNGTTRYGDWTLSLSQIYVDTTQPLVETGTQVEQTAYSTVLSAALQMSSQSSLQLSVNQNFRFTSELSNLRSWSTSDWYNYQFQPQLSGGLGVTVGYDDLSGGVSTSAINSRGNPFEQGQARLIFQPGPKLNLMVSGGLEDRQFIDQSAPPVINPIFAATGTYQFTSETRFSISANRTVTPALIGNELNVVTALFGDFHQTLIGKLYMDISGGYTDQSYTQIQLGPLPTNYFGVPTRSQLAVIRSDTRLFGKIELSTAIRERFTISIFYMFTDNQSSQLNFSYTGNQGGLQLNYHY